MSVENTILYCIYMVLALLISYEKDKFTEDERRITALFRLIRYWRPSY